MLSQMPTSRGMDTRDTVRAVRIILNNIPSDGREWGDGFGFRQPSIGSAQAAQPGTSRPRSYSRRSFGYATEIQAASQLDGRVGHDPMTGLERQRNGLRNLNRSVSHGNVSPICCKCHVAQWTTQWPACVKWIMVGEIAAEARTGK